MITKKKFLALAKKGWRKLGYESGSFYNTMEFDKNTLSSCIIGAAAAADNKFKAGVKPDEWAEKNIDKGTLWDTIADLSNGAGSIKEALKGVEALNWTKEKRTPW